MSIPLTQIGARDFQNSATEDVEAEYDRLRDLAREEARMRNDCFNQAHEAYECGNGALAKALSDQGKSHARKMDKYNRQASDFIFRENNSPGRVAEDELDLHGQFVEEVDDILEQRVRTAQAKGETHLHVIVGKGNHSTSQVQKLKPRVEKVCRELGLECHTEENEGRIYVNLERRQDGGGHYGGGQQQQQQGDNKDGSGGILKNSLRSLLDKCCIVM